jgi:4-hydroxy-tetrahydrodipicolinate reductase
MLEVVQVGVGPLGRMVVRFINERNALRETLRIVGAVDPAPDLVGKDLGSVSETAKLGVPIQPDIAAALEGRKADAAILTTVSDLERLVPQVEELAAAGLNIVSTCEELSFPRRTAPEAAEQLDRICREHGVTCLGTGVNPGFLMDLLPVVLTAPCQRVDRVEVQRVQDASSRRVPFQQKIGAGLTPEQFEKKKAEGTLRHVGLSESMDMIAHRMGWNLERTEEALEPVMATSEVTSGYAPIEAGMARGVEQISRAWSNGEEVIRLVFRAAVGEPESFDLVQIDGKPCIESRIAGGVNGDIATCAIVLNCIPLVVNAEPGFKTMVDLPPASFAVA